MNAKRWFGLAILFFCMSAFSGQPVPLHQYSVQVQGAVERDLAGGEIYYENNPVGRQIYLQKAGPGEDLLVLIVLLPPGERPGSYDMSAPELVSSSYFETVGGVSRQFYQNVQGTLNIRESGSAFSGALNFSADGEAGRVTVTGSFEQIPFRVSGSHSGGEGFAALVSWGVFVVFILLIVLNLVMQFYVGRQVYAGRQPGLLVLLRGSRTFWLGWQNPRLFPVMILWTLVLGLTGIVLVLALVFFNPLR
jgi:hypothetical protein